MFKSAVISGCERYRYQLVRQWRDDADSKVLHWVMLNPSTADADLDDPTIRKCIGFARFNGFDGISVVNLFAYRSTSPKELTWQRGRVDVVGPENDLWISKIPLNATVVCAWGSYIEQQPSLWWRHNAVKNMLAGRDLRCVKLSRQPWHPLYVKYGPLLEFE